MSNMPGKMVRRFASGFACRGMLMFFALGLARASYGQSAAEWSQIKSKCGLPAGTIYNTWVAQGAPCNQGSTPSQAPPKDNAAQLAGMDRVDYDALLELARQAQQTSDLARQKSLMQQFMNQSGPFIQKHPEQTIIWQLRAAAAISMNDPEEGYKAGQKLLAAGPTENSDPGVLRILAQLKNKNWLDPQGVAEAKRRIAEEKQYGWILGTWTGVNSWFQKAAFDYGRREHNVKIEFVRSGGSAVGYLINEKTNMRYKVPALQYIVPLSGKPDTASWSYNTSNPVRWQPVSSFMMDNGSGAMEFDIKHQQTKFVINKLSDATGDATLSSGQTRDSSR